jgi:hypothetical protein
VVVKVLPPELAGRIDVERFHREVQLGKIPGDRGSRFYLLSEPIFDPLRGLPRFQRVLERLGLGEAAKGAGSVRAQRASRTDRS